MDMSARDRHSGSAPSPAAPSSYGEAPRGFRLPAATRLGPVQLQVASLERSLPFYEGVLGLRVLTHAGAEVRLGPAGEDRLLVELHERRGAGPARGRLGLYHYAILLPDRPSLGRFLRHLSVQGVRPGAADHLVSEALYLTDPDGLGIEVYADRPRSAWQRTGRQLRMATDPIDVEDLLRTAGDEAWGGMPSGTVMGHVHLHVGDLDEASAFYSEALGFDRMVWSYPGALFLGAGGYHHHLGVNTWAGAAPPAAEGDARLLEWTLELPDADAVTAASRSLTAAGYAVDTSSGGDVVASDPWGTTLRLRVQRTP